MGKCVTHPYLTPRFASHSIASPIIKGLMYVVPLQQLFPPKQKAQQMLPEDRTA
jgi:hypothetical protein